MHYQSTCCPLESRAAGRPQEASGWAKIYLIRADRDKAPCLTVSDICQTQPKWLQLLRRMCCLSGSSEAPSRPGRVMSIMIMIRITLSQAGWCPSCPSWSWSSGSPCPRQGDVQTVSRPRRREGELGRGWWVRTSWHPHWTLQISWFCPWSWMGAHPYWKLKTSKWRRSSEPF